MSLALLKVSSCYKEAIPVIVTCVGGSDLGFMLTHRNYFDCNRCCINKVELKLISVTSQRSCFGMRFSASFATHASCYLLEYLIS